jgi:hypothetical protein
MRDLKRNQVKMFYALYYDKIPVLDPEGNETGETKSGYGNPVPFKARVSANKGNSEVEAFGITTDYDRTISTVEKLPIVETSVLWVDRMPELNADGSLVIGDDGNPITPYDYKVIKVAPDLNQNSWAIKKVVSN